MISFTCSSKFSKIPSSIVNHEIKDRNDAESIPEFKLSSI